MVSENLPDGWRKVIFTDVIDINRRLTIQKGTPSSFIEMKAVPEHQRKVAYTEIRSYTSGTKFKNGDTLFSRITPCTENGKTAFCDVLGQNEIGFGSTEFLVFSAKESTTDSKFIYYLSRFEPLRKYAIANMTGTSGRQRVPKDAFEKLFIALPSLSEQQKIASILSGLDDKIELNNKMNKTLEEIAKTLFKSWFVDFEPFQDGEFEKSELGMIPKGWSVQNLVNFADVQYGFAFKSKLFNSEKKGRPLIRIRNLKKYSSDTYTEEICDDKYLIEAGDIVVGMDGDFTSYFWQGKTSLLNQRVMKLSSKQSKNQVFLFIASELLFKFEEQTKVGTTVIHLGKNDVDNMRLIIPNDEIMNQFNSVVNPLFSQMITNTHQTQALSKIRDTLLPKLISGDLAV